MKFEFDDGGREKAGFKGNARDSVCRSIAIATRKPYDEIWKRLAKGNRDQPSSKNEGRFSGTFTADKGIETRRQWFKDYMAELGFKWVATTVFGKGPQAYLRTGDLPKGRLVVSLGKTFTAVVNGAIRDTKDPSNDGARSITGYWEYRG